MLSASQCGARSPLSPLTQSTLEKHLPGLTSRRFLQRNKPSTADVGCITGKDIKRIDKCHRCAYACAKTNQLVYFTHECEKFVNFNAFFRCNLTNR